MTGEAYDHMTAAIVLGAIFVASVFVVPSLSYVNLLYLDQQQLQNVALSAMKTILFDEGYPTNWGSMHGTNMFNENDVKRFGLSLLGDQSFFVLDPDKVHRLSSNNPLGSISYQKMKGLMGLSGYDFSLEMKPLFHVDHNVQTTYPNDQTASIIFRVNVSRYDGRPVPDAIVWTTIIYVTDANPPVTSVATVKNITNSLGRCQGSKTVSVGGSDKMMDVLVIFRVTVADRATMVVSSQDTQNPTVPAKIDIVGDTIVLTNPANMTGPKGTRHVLNILMYNFETSMNMLNGTRTGGDNNDYKLTYGKGYDLWERTFAGLSLSEPSVFIFTFDAVEPPRTVVLMVGTFTMWSGGGIIQFNDVPPSSGASVSVKRDVIIAGMAYIAELRLWKT